MKHTIIALFLSLSVFAAEPAKVEPPKPPTLTDAQKARIWKAVATVREIELAQRELATQREKADSEIKAAIAEAQKPGFTLDRDLNLVAEVKEVKK